MMGLHGQPLYHDSQEPNPSSRAARHQGRVDGFFLGDASPVRWKGPDLSPVWLGLMEMNVIREFLLTWCGELDYPG